MKINLFKKAVEPVTVEAKTGNVEMTEEEKDEFMKQYHEEEYQKDVRSAIDRKDWWWLNKYA